MRDRVHVVGIMAAGGAPPVARFKDGMRERGLVEGENVVFHERIAHGDSTRLAGFAQDMARLRVDLIAAVGAVTARAARAASAKIPIVYSVVVEPAGDDLASPSGDPLRNMTGVTTFDVGQAAAQIALLRSVKPDLARIAYLSDAAVSDCLRSASMRAAQEAGLRAIDVRVGGAEPDLQMAFARMREYGTQALVALENPIIGVHAAQIAERALSQNLPALLALDQAGAGGLLSYGTSLGQAAHRMAWQVSRLLDGDTATELPIETLRCPDLVVDMRPARRLGLTVPPEVLRRAGRVIQ
ncbi:ABC transporter substrate-binding protein [Bradyrhizobium sp. BR 10289]|uniref:ABC transporter substrate-binding protein n=1 Tax=Bradyrhizobium sp. BR 10289 TaxID=2749993 RepID=UPI001C6533D7|nr:ABC transporter substrate-binding protein [Bradyrhizobium sp. BR 10289]MBW7969055.1 ABC transporter substrate-binding protein [Bradyrhizobium sp. BR 10289]